jgi:murein DD-endopeptidase MepM/ murein hydrolase activator NlpD
MVKRGELVGTLGTQGNSNPYIGPRPFERQDSKLFFGRSQEANELLSLIVANRAVVLYAPSGAGKTSLLNALVVPLLEKEGGLQVYPFARVRGPALAGIDPADVPNLYVFYSLLSWCGSAADPQMLAKQTIPQFLASPLAEVQEPAAAEDVVYSIGEFLVEPTVEPADEEGLPPARVLIFDQFEELFTTFPERWRDREGLFNQLEKALHDDPLLRVVFSLREDYVALLDPYAPLMPKSLRTRFRLERMRPEAALAAVRNPLRGTGREFAPGVAEQLVEDLRKVRVQAATGETMTVTGEFIEPVQLQVVCQNLWQDLPAGVNTITQEHLKTYGNVTQALSRFYERAVSQVVAATRLEESVLRDWFARTLITPAGTRGTVYRGQVETGGISNEAIDLLENQHIIRGEWRAGARWYELTHDRLIEPIQGANRAWREKQRQVQRRRVTAWIGGAAALVGVVLCLALLYITYLTVFQPDEAVIATSVYESARETAMAEGAMQGTEVAQATGIAGTATRMFEVTEVVVTSNAAARETLVALATRQAEGQSIATQTAQAGGSPTPTVTPGVGGTVLPVSPTPIHINDLLSQTGFFPILSEAEQLGVIAGLFSLESTQQDDYDLLARELFYSLDSTEQIGVFANQNNLPPLEQSIVTAIRGLLPSLPSQSEGTDALLHSMYMALVGANGNANFDLQEELLNWRTGQLALLQGDAGVALEAFNLAIELDRGNPALYYNRALAYSERGATAEALADLETVLQLVSNPTLSIRQTAYTGESAQRVIGGFITADQVREYAGQAVCAESALVRQLSVDQARYPLLAQTNVLRPFTFAAWPTDSGNITQEFGANPAYYQQFGLPGHDGLDFEAAAGSPVYAVADGRVERVETRLSSSIYGVYVRIRHEFGCQTFRTTYAQLSQTSVFEGQWVVAGEQIALSGSSGNTFSAHLHLTLQQAGVNNGNWPSNIIDPTPFLPGRQEQQLQTAP